MNLRRKSLAELYIERDALEAEMAAHAARLAARQAPAEQFAPALMPQAERLVALRAQILRRTPARALMRATACLKSRPEIHLRGPQTSNARWTRSCLTCRCISRTRGAGP